MGSLVLFVTCFVFRNAVFCLVEQSVATSSQFIKCNNDNRDCDSVIRLIWIIQAPGCGAPFVEHPRAGHKPKN